MNNEITSNKFFTAGHALFTVSNPAGEHYTHKIVRAQENEKYDSTPLFVSMLTGPDNTRDYTYMGILSTGINNMCLRLTQKSKYAPDTKPVKVFNWVMFRVNSGQGMPAGYSLHHEGRCARCGRLLTVTESVKSGFGPECIEKVFPSEEKLAAQKAKLDREAAECAEWDRKHAEFKRKREKELGMTLREASMMA
jgi:hypothetical protein